MSFIEDDDKWIVFVLITHVMAEDGMVTRFIRSITILSTITSEHPPGLTTVGVV